TSPEEAYRKFDVIASKHTEQLRKCTKRDEVLKRSINEYEDVLAKYIRYSWHKRKYMGFGDVRTGNSI
ncbi:Tetratricopeptide repeat protein 30Alike, partial [Caligus rogercresseyi]